jgi:hypothetical protein
MAHYEHLPIYREAMRLAVHLENVVRGFARYHKYTLGSEMRSGAHEIVALIIKANSAADRLPVGRVTPHQRDDFAGITAKPLRFTMKPFNGNLQMV